MVVFDVRRAEFLEKAVRDVTDTSLYVPAALSKCVTIVVFPSLHQ